MELFRDRHNVEQFLNGIGSLLHKMDIYLDTVHTDDLSQTVALRHLELIDTLQLMKSHFVANRFPQQMSRPERRVSDSNNNNSSQSLLPSAPERVQTKHTACMCDDLQDVYVVSRLLDISDARQAHFSSSLINRMRMSGDQSFALYKAEILVSNHSGWLSVDEEHKYFAVVSDCLFCLFESESSTASLMTAILNDSHSQAADSSHYQNAFTITITQDDLYFCATSSQDRADWIKWLNVGAQLPYSALIRNKSQPATNDVDTQTDASRVKSSTDKSQPSEHLTKPATECADATDASDISEPVKMRKKAPVLKRQEQTRGKTQSVIIDNERIRSKTSTTRPASSYDWTLDQGTSRHFPSKQELEKEIGISQISTFQKRGTVAPRHKFSLPADTSRPQYIDTRRPKISLQHMKSVSFEERPTARASWGSRLVRRASSLFVGKTGSFKVTKDEKQKESKQFTSSVAAGRLSEDMGVGSLSKSCSLPAVNMADLCEVQGYLLYRKTLKWVLYYCCVYNGTFSCFKDQKSSLPEVQSLLSRCQIIPMKGKKPFSFKLISDTKSAYFAAVSDIDLHAWYTVFNNYIKGALALSKYRGGAYALWQWSGDAYQNSSIITHLISSAYNDSIDEEEASYIDEDLPMVEKTSADGASHHSDDSGSPRIEQQQRGMKDDKLPNQKTSRADKKVSFEGRGEELDVVGSRLSFHEESVAMRSVSESDNKPRKHARRLMTEKSLSHYFCRSVDDVTDLGSSNSSSGDEDVSAGIMLAKPRKTHEERRKNLLDKMMKEKLRIELALQQKKRKDDEEIENEVLVNMTKLQQRRVSTQLKYDFLEKQLQEKREDKSRYSGLFPKSNKVEKAGKVSSAPTADTTDSNHHIRQQMEELKHKLDSLDRGLTETKSKHTTTVNKVMKNCPALTDASINNSTTDSLSQHKLKGLESIIETLETPKHQYSNIESETHTLTTNNNGVKCSQCCKPAGSPTPLHIRPETLAVINEFEAMINGCLSRPSAVDDDDS